MQASFAADTVSIAIEVPSVAGVAAADWCGACRPNRIAVTEVGLVGRRSRGWPDQLLSSAGLLFGSGASGRRLWRQRELRPAKPDRQTERACHESPTDPLLERLQGAGQRRSPYQ